MEHHKEEVQTKTLVTLTLVCLVAAFLLSFFCYLWEENAFAKEQEKPPDALAVWVKNDLQKRTAHLSNRTEEGRETVEKKTVTLLWTSIYSAYNGSDQSNHARAAFIDDDGELYWFPTIKYTPLDGQESYGTNAFCHAGRYLAQVVVNAAAKALLGDKYALPEDLTHEYVIDPYPLYLADLTLTAQDKEYDGTTHATITDAQICLTGPFEGQTAYLRIQGAFMASQSDFGASVTVTDVELANTYGHRTADFDLRDVFDLHTSANILPKPINAAQAEFEAEKTYSGDELTFAVRRVTVDGLNADFAVVGNTATDVGSYRMTVYGTGNFTGTLTLGFNVRSEVKPQVTVDAVSDVTYDGTAHTPRISVRADGRALIPGRDYTVVYSGGIEAGTATATVMLQGEYNGSIEQTFTVQPKTLMDTNGILFDNAYYIYSGEEIIPVVTIMDGNRYLKEGRDFDLIYVDNVYPGTGSVTVNYKGNYSGSATYPFEIKIQKCTTHWLLLCIFMVLVVGIVIDRIFRLRWELSIAKNTPSLTSSRCPVLKDNTETDANPQPNRKAKQHGGHEQPRIAPIAVLCTMCTLAAWAIGFGTGCMLCITIWFCIVLTSAVAIHGILKKKQTK